jgi:hypothetical protein
MTRARAVSQKSLRFTESVIREMTRLAQKARRRQPVSQVFPDFPAAGGDQGGRGACRGRRT